MKLSVLMSVYNGEKYLREAIESILSQTFKDFEFIIINDASTDKSKEIVFSYNDPRIVYLENEKNLDLTKSLNIGLKIAKGEYVARMDADDVSFPKRLEKQVIFLDKNKDFAVVGSRSELIDEDGSTTSIKKECFSSEQLFYNLQFGNVFSHSSVMIRKNLLDAAHGYDEKFIRSQDLDLWNRLSKKNPIGMIDEILLKLRISGESCSQVQKTSQQNFAKMVFERDMKKLFPEENNDFFDIVRCFHDINVLGWNNVRINLRQIMLLRKINRKIIKNSPDYINREKLKKIAGRRILLFLKKRLGDYIKKIF